MDRRFLLAIVLSVMVLMISQVFLAPPPQRRTTGQAVSGAPDSATTTTPRTMEPPVLSATDPAAVTTDEPRRLSLTGLDRAADENANIVVKTEDYRATFTNRGAQLTSWELLRFDDPNRNPVQLVRGASELDVVLETPQGPLDLGQTLFELREQTLEGGARRLTFEAGSQGGARITKTYTLPAEGYMVGLEITVTGAADAVSYRLVWDGGIPPAEANEKQYQRSAGTIVMLGDSKETVRPGAFKKTREKEIEGNVRWAGVRNKYFMAVMIPPPETSSRVVATGSQAEDYTGVELVMPLLRGAAADEYSLYLGPMDFENLQAAGHDLEQAVDLGWKLFRPISKLLLTVMVWMYAYIPNYGVVIIIISVLTKLMFYPLTRTSVKSMRAMQRIQPEIQALRDKYKSDPQRQQKEMMGLYKKHKVNPMGGCLPIVVQMPVFIALYSVLANSITMRGANFMLWMNDLSSPDTLFSVAGFAIHILPVILFVTTIAQQKLTPMGADPRQKMLGYMMPIVMLFIFYSFPAGLNLYWTINNVLTVAQQWMIHREEPAAPAPAGA